MSSRDSETGRLGAGISRRELLSYTWFVSLAALGIAGVRSGLQFAMPLPRAGEFGGFIDMGPLAELPEPGGAPLNHPEGRFWLVTTDSGLLALHKACTHLDCLGDWDEQNREFICPCHGSRFAADGTYLAGPAARSLDRFVVQVLAADGELVAETDPAVGNPVPLTAGGLSPTAALSRYDGKAPAAADLSEADEEEIEDPAYTIVVDTGRRIQGAAADQSIAQG